LFKLFLGEVKKISKPGVFYLPIFLRRVGGGDWVLGIGVLGDRGIGYGYADECTLRPLRNCGV
jgi:hypothetical protein